MPSQSLGLRWTSWASVPTLDYLSLDFLHGGKKSMPYLFKSHISQVFNCCSVPKSCPTLCDRMDCSKPGFPVLHCPPEFAQTHVHWVSDAIQPSHPQSTPHSPAFNLSQHQGLFQWVSSLHQVAQSIGISASASVLPVNIQDRFPLGLTGLISLQSKGLSRVFSSTTTWKQRA